MSYWDWGYYKPKPLIKAKGGIRAQSKRGAFGESWWAKRWIATLESFDIGARLSRGRSYARRGQVLSIDIGRGQVKAKVQGSFPEPYKIRIEVTAIPETDWRRLAASLSSQALFAAKLLAGEMPEEIEAAFRAAGLSLFPEKLRDLETDCSCPDWSNPCKHIAAVYYLLGEEFDRDPFLLFRLRGMDRKEFVKLMGAATPAPAVADPAADEIVALPPQPLSPDATAFWQGDLLPDELFGEVRLPPVSAAMLKRLGNFPFWRGTETLVEALDPIYTRAASRGLDVFVGAGEIPPPR